jgi:hypothetical protein
MLWVACLIGWACFVVAAFAAHTSGEGTHDTELSGPHNSGESGHDIPGLSFRVFVDRGAEAAVGRFLDQTHTDAALRTVIDTFSYLDQHRLDHPRFDEAVNKGLLERVIIQLSVRNHEGKSFPFLVVRTVDPGRVRLLISASSMKEQGHLGTVERFAPALAREFQWVVRKAQTGHKPKTVSIERDLPHAPIRTDKEIRAFSGEERVRLLQQLFETYLRTVDDQRSLEGQSYYDIGSTNLVAPSQPDSAIKFYDVLVREALQKIVREPVFLERTPLAVTSLLNGAVWNVAFVKIDRRDWATRTRVLPTDRAVMVGKPARRIQPAAILINIHRKAAPDDPFYADVKHLPMGALSADQLVLVIAKEIQQNIVEKSQTGHVAQDALTAP